LFTDEEWPEGEWPGRLVRVATQSAAGFSRTVDEARAPFACDVFFSLERVSRCDVYRAGDGVHAAWLERRARFEPFWKRWFRGLNRKHAEILALENSLFREQRAGRVIANSQLVRDEIVRHFDYPADRIDVVYNGLPALRIEPEWRHSTRQALGLGESEYTALFAGSGWERKGLRFAIDAVRKMNGVTLLVAGRGNSRGWPACDRVRFLGPRKDLPHLFAAADVFVLPTIYDPFSNACLEALAAGLPVITTRANGFAEIVVPDRDGTILDEPDDTPALAAALNTWRDPARCEDCRARLIEKGTQFSIDRNLRETLAVLEKARANT
jgi:UDP-glucose:(heptosyl)LPS alpha-1,3-glucosyltransferase